MADIERFGFEPEKHIGKRRLRQSESMNPLRSGQFMQAHGIRQLNGTRLNLRDTIGKLPFQAVTGGNLAE
jgi:hypothetical protein